MKWSQLFNPVIALLAATGLVATSGSAVSAQTKFKDIGTESDESLTLAGTATSNRVLQVDLKGNDTRSVQVVSGNKAKQHGNFALDPTIDQEKIQRRIARSIEEQIHNLDHSEVQAAVKDKYEDLLANAKVKQHVPTLTEGVVRGEFRHQRNGKDKE